MSCNLQNESTSLFINVGVLAHVCGVRDLRREREKDSESSAQVERTFVTQEGSPISVKDLRNSVIVQLLTEYYSAGPHFDDDPSFPSNRFSIRFKLDCSSATMAISSFICDPSPALF